MSWKTGFRSIYYEGAPEPADLRPGRGPEGPLGTARGEDAPGDGQAGGPARL